MAKNYEGEDGGPAFPKPCDECSHRPGGRGRLPCNAAHDGMTLRDWFAGQALAGLYSLDSEGVPGPAESAKLAYGMADAMLSAR